MVDKYCSASTAVMGFEKRRSATLELLHHLIADNAAARLDCTSDQLPGLRSLLRRTCVKGIYEDVCIEKEPIVHSFRPD